VPFSVNSLAQAAALASLEVEEELLARCQGVTTERDRVRAELLAMGYPVPDSQTNFVWLPLGEQTTDFAEHCLSHKIVIRPFPGDGARVTISDAADNELFLAAARSWRTRPRYVSISGRRGSGSAADVAHFHLGLGFGEA
jgi:histidinol-phosphate aminotransferase